MKMNLLDRAISAVSPRAGLARLRARTAVEMLRGYDAASPKKRGGGWVSQGSSANAELAPALVKLRSSSREMVRNNPYAARIVETLVAHDVGAGLVARPRTGKKALDKRISEVWKAWAETTQCDAEGQLDLYGLQALVRRTVAESGECLVRIRWRRAEDGLAVPLQLQVLEPDHLDHMKTQLLEGGGRILMGVEFDALGRRVAYWLFRDHPGDALVLSSASVRVPASEVLHVYRKTRAGQVRGVPELAPVMTRLQDLADYHEASLVRAKMEACLAILVEKADNEDTFRPLGPTETDEQGHRVESLYPGMVEYLAPGEKVSTLNPTPSAAHSDFSRTALQAAGVGAGVTYDQVTGDLSQANYSSLRAGKIEFRRGVEQRQWQMLVPMLCAPIWSAFIRAGSLAGLWPVLDAKAVWTPPAHELIDPAKDGGALVTSVRAGLQTWGQAVSSMGYDPDDQLAEIAEWQKKFDAVGVILETDPRQQRPGMAPTAPPEPAQE